MPTCFEEECLRRARPGSNYCAKHAPVVYKTKSAMTKVSHGAGFSGPKKKAAKRPAKKSPKKAAKRKS